MKKFAEAFADGFETPASAAAIAKVRLELPRDFVEFLRVSNGAQLNNAVFFGTKELAWRNRELALTDAIALGGQGNLELYVYLVKKRRYAIVNMFAVDEVRARFLKFERMFLQVCREQL